MHPSRWVESLRNDESAIHHEHIQPKLPPRSDEIPSVPWSVLSKFTPRRKEPLHWSQPTGDLYTKWSDGLAEMDQANLSAVSEPDARNRRRGRRSRTQERYARLNSSLSGVASQSHGSIAPDRLYVDGALRATRSERRAAEVEATLTDRARAQSSQRPRVRFARPSNGELINSLHSSVRSGPRSASCVRSRRRSRGTPSGTPSTVFLSPSLLAASARSASPRYASLPPDASVPVLWRRGGSAARSARGADVAERTPGPRRHRDRAPAPMRHPQYQQFQQYQPQAATPPRRRSLGAALRRAPSPVAPSPSLLEGDHSPPTGHMDGVGVSLQVPHLSPESRVGRRTSSARDVGNDARGAAMEAVQVSQRIRAATHTIFGEK